MLYLSGNVKGNLLGVVDTDDMVEEFYSKEYLLSTGLEIIRLTKELEVGYTFNTKCFDFALEEVQGILGWRLRARNGVSVFKNKPYYMGYPVVSLNKCFSGYAGQNLDLRGMDTSRVRDMKYIFQYCTRLTSLNLSNFDTSLVQKMGYMFFECSSLTSIDLSNFNTSQVTDTGNMFENCSSLTSLDLSNFNTSQVRNMSCMFSGCSSLTSLDLSNFNTSRVQRMAYMFSDCSGLTSLNLSSFDTSQVKRMGYMFSDCSSLTSLDLSNFDTGQVKNISNIFIGCSNLILKVSSKALITKSVRLNLVKYPNNEVNFDKVVDNAKHLAKLILTMPSGSIIGVKEW